MFRDYTLKDYVEVCHLIIRREVSVERFMSVFELSRYEYNICKDRLKELEANYGICFHFDNKTISLTVVDEERFNACEEHFWHFFNRHRHNYLTDTEYVRIHYIIKRLLLADYTNAETLADEMGFSRSNLRWLLKGARTILDRYGISVKSTPYKGVFLSGGEFRIRRALCNVYNFLNPSIIEETDHPGIAEDFSPQRYGKLLALIQDTLERHGRRCTQVQLHQIAVYLVVSNARRAEGHEVLELDGVDESVLNILQAPGPLYTLSSGLLRSGENELGYAFCSEPEIRALALMLLELFLHQEDIHLLLMDRRKEEITRVTELLLNYFADRYTITFNPSFRALLEWAACELVAKRRMGVLEELGTTTAIQLSSYLEQPIMSLVLSDMRSILSKFFKAHVSANNCINICSVTSMFLQNCDYRFPRLRIGFCTAGSRLDAKIMRTALEQYLDPGLYESLEECEIEVLHHGEEWKQRFDFMFCNQRVSGDPRLLSIFGFDGEFVTINNYLRQSRNLYRDILRDRDIKYEPMDIQNAADATRLLERLNQYAALDRAGFERLIQAQTGYHNSVVLVIPAPNAEHSTLQFGMLTKKYQGTYRDQTYTKYVAFAGRIVWDNIRLINKLLFELVHNTEFFNALADAPMVQTLNEHLNPLLK